MNRLNRQLLLCAATIAATSVAGCAPDAAADDGAVDESNVSALQAPADTGITVPNPNGVYFAEVTALGTGCPAGTWNTSISKDGQVFTTTFSAYETTVNATTNISIKDCVLKIKLHSPNGLSYAVSKFYYSGFAFLGQGVRGTQSASYWFMGDRVPPSNSNRTALTGPYDDEFVFEDEIETTDTVWSPCGKDRELNVLTRLTLQNATPATDGYMNLAAIDGSTKLVFTLATRPCPGAPAVPTPDGGVVVRN